MYGSITLYCLFGIPSQIRRDVHITPYEAYRHEGTFAITTEDGRPGRLQYEFEFDGQKRRFSREVYPYVRDEYSPRYALCEDLTERFIAEYPGLEKLLTVQLL